MTPILETLYIVAVVLCAIVALIVFSEREAKQKPKKHDVFQTPEDIWLHSTLLECRLHGVPHIVYIDRHFYDALNNPRVLEYYLPEGLKPITNSVGFYTMSIVYTSGLRVDYDYGAVH